MTTNTKDSKMSGQIKIIGKEVVLRTSLMVAFPAVALALLSGGYLAWRGIAAIF